MNFALNDEQKAMVKTLVDFSKKELLPEYCAWDRKREFPRGSWSKMAEIGVLGINIPAEHDGQDADNITTGLVVEEISKGDINCGCALVVQILQVEILKKCAGEEVNRRWLPLVGGGEKLLAMGLTEPHCGTDASALLTRAVKKGDKYVLNGEKSGVTLGPVADAVIIFAKTKPEAGARGVSAFLVPMDLPGITRQSYEDMGSKPVIRGSIFMEDVEVPAEYLVGPENGGFIEVMKGFDFSRVLLGLMCLGAAQITLEETIRYVKERHAFGRPLAKFEGVSFPIAEHVSMIEAVHWLSYYALWLRDQGLPNAKGASMCKWMAPRFSVNAIHDCLLLHGHYGYTQEFPIEQRLRDVMGIEIADGTAQVSKIVISRELFGKEYLPY
ncbi:MAG: cyclohexanecarboxyl-CoA dehydrogenase [Peptococcaceae bacterium]|nr:MAG: cyclohexanecarboxyl-CoA dehydrogenase [Peptococcaceae bacterium]